MRLNTICAAAAMSLLGTAVLSLNGSVPAMAGYTSNCGTIAGATPVAGGLSVYVSPGRTGQANLAAGVCLDNSASGGVSPLGGDAEVGFATDRGVFPTSGSPGVDAVLDGSDTNPSLPPVGPVPGDMYQGYVGVSNFETGSPNDGENCGCAGGSNSGGEFGIKSNTLPVVGGGTFALPFIVCGDTTGPDWDANSRDGCFVP